MNFLDNIRIVMVNTTLPANIGSAARAMMTMGVKELVLVKPKHAIDDTSVAHAKGGGEILDKAMVVEHLSNAINDCHLVVAASARNRHLPRPMLTPTRLAYTVEYFCKQNPTAKIALLFGREDRGLTNDELSVADFHVQIDTNPAYGVLNVASSIQVILAFLYAHAVNSDTPNTDSISIDSPNTDIKNTDIKNTNTANKNTLIINHRQQWDEPAITFGDKQKLNHALLDLYQMLGVAHSDNLAELPNRLSRLTSRLQLDQKEYALLMTLLYKIKPHLALHK